MITTSNLPRAIDQDCDGYPLLTDCDDEDENSNNIGNDADCDGYQNDNDCHPEQAIDDHPKSEDMDCDDILADADCDDENPLVLERSADGTVMARSQRLTAMIQIRM